MFYLLTYLLANLLSYLLTYLLCMLLKTLKFGLERLPNLYNIGNIFAADFAPQFLITLKVNNNISFEK